jgi:DNA-binding IclR family transcriptional regulator
MSQSATVRCLEVLEFLADKPQGLALGEISLRLGMPKSIAHRLLVLLAARGYVRQLAGGNYALTLKLALLGLRYHASTGLGDLSQPILDRLAAETGELARLAVVDGERLVWVGKAQGAKYGLRYEPNAEHDTGRPVFLHATATGKAWLASLPEARALELVRTQGFPVIDRFGPNVIRSEAGLRRALAETRRRGYGLAVGEGETGTTAIAVGVRAAHSGNSDVVATLSLAGPTSRFGADRLKIFAHALAAAADELAAIWHLCDPLNRSDARATAPTRETGREIAHVA